MNLHNLVEQRRNKNGTTPKMRLEQRPGTTVRFILALASGLRGAIQTWIVGVDFVGLDCSTLSFPAPRLGALVFLDSSHVTGAHAYTLPDFLGARIWIVD
jgi:hypothetical protein